jgi:signal transduction histidine kinase
MMDSDPTLPWSRVATFVRQHTHDVRNQLNGLDLEAALLNEIISDPEAVETVKRIRNQLRTVAADLRALAARFVDPKPTAARLAASELFAIWQEQAARVGLNVTWSSSLLDEELMVDAAMVAGVLEELLANAKKFGRGEVLAGSAEASGGRATFELREPGKTPDDPATWGCEPFVSTTRSSYGLGLWQAGRAITAHGGAIEREMNDDSVLVTRLTLPVAA